MPKPKHTFWAVDGIRYGRVDAFPTPEAFLERIYGVTFKEDEDHAFCEDWKTSHPLPAFLLAETPKVRRESYRYGYADGGNLYLVEAPLGRPGVFELWEWEGK